MSSNTIKVNELFYSIEGEGIRAGYPCIFVRLYGCNLRCSYCDSMYANEGEDFREMELSRLLEDIRTIHNLSNPGCKRITVTGGEPLLQESALFLIKALLDEGYEVNVETNGSISIEPLIRMCNNSPELIITMDWKCKSSGHPERNRSSNLGLLRECDVLKFVVGSTEDLSYMLGVLCAHPDIHATCFVSPVFNKIEPAKIVDFLKAYNVQNVRLQLQLHKFIWDPNERGV